MKQVTPIGLVLLFFVLVYRFVLSNSESENMDTGEQIARYLARSHAKLTNFDLHFRGDSRTITYWLPSKTELKEAGRFEQTFKKDICEILTHPATENIDAIQVNIRDGVDYIFSRGYYKQQCTNQ